MSDVAIKVEHVYKQYKLGLVNTGTLVHDINRWWHKINGKQDPYEILTGENDRAQKTSNDYVWALKDINFDVVSGEVLGIIGKNGAGKSTLLKILSKVTSPTKGNIKVRGRIASLLEVGTGFHPELTGRENIFLNGAILGMTKNEIRSKFDEIVAFSGVEKYIDTPVKRYSSGMYVRLAFAVAAHLEPEILIVDEVLAVGDADFQKKCLGKMKDVSGEGRTVLFVSHNMAAVRSLCNRGIFLENGIIKSDGITEEVLDLYNSNNNFTETDVKWEIQNAPGNQNAKIQSIRVYSESGLNYIEEDIFVEVVYENYKDEQVLNVSLSIFDDKDNYLIASPNLDRKKLKKGTYKSVCKLSKNTFNLGKCFFTILLIGDNFEIIANLDKVVSIDLIEEGTKRGEFYGHWSGLVRPYFEWTNFKN
jgi:lipopolysaccharide transport system ATP-binding protein